jgi:hypothetical protein
MHPMSKELKVHWLSLQIDLKTDQDHLNLNDMVNRGFLFKDSINDCCYNFIELASRTFAQYAIERHFMSIYTINGPMQCNTKVLEVWITSRAQCDVNTEFGRNFREFIYEMMLPMGCRTRLLRSNLTMHNKPNAQTLLDKELGVDLAQEILTG